MVTSKRTMKQLKKKLSSNLSRVQEKITSACARSGRGPSDVTLIAVTKSVGLEVIRAPIELGQLDLAESRAQALVKRSAMLEELSQRAKQASVGSQPSPADTPPVRWHMVGHLQRNKVTAVLNCSRKIHSVDSLRLAEDINAKASKLNMSVEVLMEVNCSGESSKYGIIPAAVNHLAEQFSTLENLRLVGLMTMGPLTENPEDSRLAFVRLREILEDMHRGRHVDKTCRHLSMGTTQDYAVAIEEGSTMVRLGRALFEGL